MTRYESQRIGHGGASALAPGNTLASFDAALDVGIDMVEFDVRQRRRELVLAHTLLDARSGRSVRLHDALAHLAGMRFCNVALNVDVKHIGYELALLDELRQAKLLERTRVSSQVPAVLNRIGELEPGLRTGISIGGKFARWSRQWSDWRAHVLAGLTSRRWEVLMAQHRLVDASLLADVIGRGGVLCTWTVNERAAIQSLQALGVHGIRGCPGRCGTSVTVRV
jgi:glycerophosphoryl diester phosphodiesterase